MGCRVRGREGGGLSTFKAAGLRAPVSDMRDALIGVEILLFILEFFHVYLSEKREQNIGSVFL